MVKPLDTVFPCHQRIERFVVLSGVDKTAIDDGVRRNHRRIGLAHVLLDPAPDLIRTALIILPGKIAFRRRQHRVAGLFCGGNRVVKRDGTVILRYKQDGARIDRSESACDQECHSQRADFFMIVQWKAPV